MIEKTNSLSDPETPQSDAPKEVLFTQGSPGFGVLQ